MKPNTSVSVLHFLLCKGVHLNEIQRFIDAAPHEVDPAADTVPAPPPSMDGSVDPDTAPTPKLPPRPERLPETAPAASLLDLSRQPDAFWDEVAGLVECLP